MTDLAVIPDCGLVNAVIFVNEPIEDSPIEVLYLRGLQIHRLEALTLFKNLEKVFLDTVPANLPKKLLPLIEIR